MKTFFLAVLVSVSASWLVGCEVASKGENGAECQKNVECESELCISGVCRPPLSFDDAGAPSDADATAQ